MHVLILGQRPQAHQKKERVRSFPGASFTRSEGGSPANPNNCSDVSVSATIRPFGSPSTKNWVRFSRANELKFWINLIYKVFPISLLGSFRNFHCSADVRMVAIGEDHIGLTWFDRTPGGSTASPASDWHAKFRLWSDSLGFTRIPLNFNGIKMHTQRGRLACVLLECV